MRKLKKPLFIAAICFILLFVLQKAANYYIERQINNYLSPYGICAELEKMDRLTFNYRGISLTCSIETKGKELILTLEKNSILSKLLPDKIQIPLY